MKVFVVGGFVRDRLLGLEPKDVDFVVVGCTNITGLCATFGLGDQVGADFPVFLDMIDREWALARTERKVGPGYKGFEVDASASITIEEDLGRRDLTINAMAIEVVDWTDDGDPILADEIIDPFGGQEDLKAGWLRHVSEAFAEDPVRVLRVARFVARFDFKIADSTRKLMIKLANDGELDHLVPERIMAETEKAMMEKRPELFFGSLPVHCRRAIFPKMNLHGNHTLHLAALNQADRLTRWVALLHSVSTDKFVLKAIKAPNDVCQAVSDFERFDILSNCFTTEGIWKMLHDIRAFSDNGRLLQLVRFVPFTLDTDLMHLGNLLLNCARDCEGIGFDSLSAEQMQTLKGKEIGDQIDELRRDVISGHLYPFYKYQDEN